MRFSEPMYNINEDVGLAQFSLHLSNPLSISITLDVFNTNITALGKHSSILISYGIMVTYNVTGGGVDYNSGPYPVIILAGETDVQFDVMINDDDVLEGNETFYLTINLTTSLPSYIVVGNPGQATVTIVDNDGKYGYSYYLVVCHK